MGFSKLSKYKILTKLNNSGSNNYYIALLEENSKKFNDVNKRMNDLQIEKNGLDIELRKAKEELVKATKEKEDFKLFYDQERRKVEQAGEKENDLTIQKNKMNHEIEDVKTSLAMLSKEKKELSIRNEELCKEIEQFKKDKVLEKETLDHMKLEIGKKELEIQRLEDNINNLRSHMDTKEKELAVKSEELVLYKNKTSETEIVSFKLNTLNIELDEAKSKLNTCYKDLANLKTKIEAKEDENMNLCQERKLLENKLKLKEEKVDELNRRIGVLEDREEKMRGDLIKYENTKFQLDELKVKNSLQQQSNDRTRELELNIKTMEYAINDHKMETERLNNIIKSLSGSNEKLQKEILEKREECNKLKDQLLDIDYKQKHIKGVIERVEKNGEIREDQLIRLEDQIRQKEEHIQSLNKKNLDLGFLLKKAQEALADNEIIRNKKEKMVKDLQHDKEEHTKNMSALQENLNKTVKELSKTNSEMSNHKEKVKVLTKQVSQLESECGLKDNKIVNLQDQCDKILQANEKMRNQKEEFFKMSSTLKEVKNTNFSNQTEELTRQNALLKEQVQSYQIIEKDLKTKLLSLDADRDELEEDLDDKLQAIEGLTNELNNKKTEMKEFVEEHSKLELAYNNISYKLEKADDDKQDLLHDMETLISDDKMYKERLQKLEKEKFDLSSDLQMLAAENKTISNDLLLAMKKNASLSKKLERKIETCKELEYMNSGNNLEKEQLYNNCKIFEKENQNLKYEHSRMQKEQEKIIKDFKTLQAEFYNKSIEFDQIKQQYELVNSNLDKVQNEYERMRIELNDKQMKEYDSKQYINTLSIKVETLEEQVKKQNALLCEKEKQMKNITTDFNNLKDNYIFLKRKNDQLSAQFSNQIEKSSHLENALHDERQKHANLVHTIHKNKVLSSNIESKIESVEKLFSFK